MRPAVSVDGVCGLFGLGDFPYEDDPLASLPRAGLDDVFFPPVKSDHVSLTPADTFPSKPDNDLPDLADLPHFAFDALVDLDPEPAADPIEPAAGLPDFPSARRPAGVQPGPGASPEGRCDGPGFAASG